jgi:hypothetical protein
MNSYNNRFGIQLFTARKKKCYGNKDFADYFPSEEKERKVATEAERQNWTGC